jgi:RHS repeat-associated protein
VDAATSTTALSLGTVINGSIAKPGEQDEFTFTGTVGQQLYYDSLGDVSGNLNTKLISPNGNTIFDIRTQNDRGPFYLTETGTYRLVVDGIGAATADYKFQVLDVGAAPTLSTDIITTGSLDSPQAVSLYRLPGIAGQRLSFAPTSDFFFADAATFAESTKILQTSGGTEDGYDGIDAALNGLSFRPGAAVNFILVTDEDRDNTDPSLTFSSILNALSNQQALLNAVINGNFRNTNNQTVLGVDSAGQAYLSNGTGGYTITAIGSVVGDGTTKADYIDLALATGGAAWDLNQLRSGGLTATSFTQAFVDIKAREILEQLPITVIASDPTVSFENLTGAISGIGAGQTATFNTKLTGDGIARSFDLLFVRPESGTILGSIPVTINNNYFYLAQAVDPDNDTLTYSLRQAPTGATIDANTGRIHWQPAQGGDYQFSIEVDDGRGGRSTQDYIVTVKTGQPNTAPTITSTAVTTTAIGRPYTYAVQATDPDDDTLAYYLSEAPEGLTIDRTTGVISWTPTQTQLGNQSVNLRVLDGRGGEANQSFTLAVTPDVNNQAPVIQTTPVTQVIAGEVYRYNVNATDGNGDPITFDLPLKPEGMTIDATTGSILWQPTAAQVGNHTIVLRARDGYGGLDLQAFDITVVSLNNAPTITSSPVLEAVAGLPYQYQIRAQDADGDAIAFRLDTPITGLNIDSNSGVITWTPINTQIGQQTVQITASDGKGGEATQTFDIQVVASATNAAPEITSTPRTTIPLGSNYLYSVAVSDPNGDPLTFSLSNAPAGMTIDQQGLISWQPQPNQLGVNPIKMTVSDGRGGVATQEFAIAVVGQFTPQTNQSPQIISTPTLTATANQSYQYNLSGSDPDGDLLVWDLATKPEGMSIDATTGRIRWQPQLTQIGQHEVVVQLVDSFGGLATQTFTLAVRGINTPPVITSTPITTAVVNQLYTYTLQAQDATGDLLNFELLAAPQGMVIDRQRGLLQWIPTPVQIGQQTVTLAVSDSQGAVTTQQYQIVVAAATINNPPKITSTPTFAAPSGQVYRYAVTASDPDGDRLTYQLLKAPTGMTIDAETGLLTWTPTNAQVGINAIQIAALDPTGAAALQSYSLAVQVNNSPVITSRPVESVTAGATYRYDLKANDPDRHPLTFTLTESPEGMTIDNFGRITWSAPPNAQGTYRVQVNVSDNFGASITQAYDLAVVRDEQAPLVNLTLSSTPVRVGQPLTVLVAASDNVGVTALNLTVNGTAIALDAQGRGTITLNQVGEFTAIAQASDASGNLGSANVSFLVIDPNDREAPQLSLTGITNGQEITVPTAIKGAIADNNLLSYTLAIAPVSGGTFREIARGTQPAADGTLGILDPTILANDSYILRLSATDAGGNRSTLDTTVDVAGQLKLGNFQLSFTDLEIPVSGIPITLTRTYDTLTTNTRNDFGYGWRMTFRDADVRTNLRPDEIYREIGYRTVGFEIGTQIYITLPNGQREKFLFRPTPFLLPGLYRPAFVATDPGVTSTLTVDSTILVGASGQFYGFYGGAYHPANFGGYYRLTTKEGIVYEINAETGKIDTITNRNGDQLTFTQAGITSSSGQKVTFGRDAQGRITTVTDPTGNQIRYEYDRIGNLIGVTDGTGDKTRFEYNNQQVHYLEKVIDPLNRPIARTEYNADGRLAQILNFNGESFRFTYDPENLVQTIRDALGNPTILEYDSRGNVITQINALGGVTRKSFDANDNILSETNPEGETTTYTYDRNGNKLTETDALGNTIRYTYNNTSRPLTVVDAVGNSTTYTYNAQGNLTTTQDGNGAITRYSYDARGRIISSTDNAGNITEYAYDNFGRLTSQINALGHTTTYTYDANGNLLTETKTQTTPTGTRTLVTTNTYDAAGRLIAETNPENQVTRYEYDSFGNFVAMIDPLGQRTEYRYDGRGRLIETIYPDSTPADLSDNPRMLSAYDALGREVARTDRAGRTTYYVYDALGRLIETIYPDGTPDDLSDNPRTKSEYDKAGREIARINELGDRTEFTYDDAGRRVQIKDALGNLQRYVYDAAGRKTAEIDALGRTTRYVYDALGRHIQTIYANGTQSTFTYDAVGNLIAIKDPAGNTTRYEYDALKRTTAVINALDQRTSYTYDEIGNLTQIKDAKNQLTRLEYDGIGQKIATVLPLGQRETFVYDAVGNLQRQTTFNGETITYTYDTNNWLIRKNLGETTTVNYTYTPTGEVSSITDGRGTTTYSYDPRNRLVQLTETDGRTLIYTYDPVGNRTSIQTPSSKTTYTYDALHRLQTVTDAGGNFTQYTYDAVGNLTRTILPNNLVETRQYDQLNRLINLTQTRPDNTVIAGYNYTLDAVGNRVSVTEGNGRRVNYSYDALYRLTREAITDAIPGDGVPPTVGDRTISYTYDAVGNRLSRNDSLDGNTTYTYDGNNRLLQATLGNQTTLYTYDNNGNLLRQTQGTNQTRYTWSPENRLLSAEIINANGTSQVQYKYNDQGIRVATIVNGQETRYLIDVTQPYAQVIEEYTPDGVVAKSYVYGRDLISQLQNGQQFVYLGDGLGSTRMLTDASGNVTDRYIYDAYGQIISQIGSTDNTYLFAGEQRDSNLDLDYLRTRYYDFRSGRFISADPFEGFLNDPMSLHKYQYAHANPVNFTDPSGLVTLQDGILVHAILGRHFVLGDPANRVTDISIAKISQETGSYIRGATGNRWRPDLTDFGVRQIYEIKPDGRFSEGVAQLNRYLTLGTGLIGQGWTVGTAANYMPLPMFVIPPIKIVRVDPPVQGVIIYHITDYTGVIIAATVLVLAIRFVPLPSFSFGFGFALAF